MIKRLPKEKEVQRMRNLITGKFGDKTTVGIGYEKEEEFYKEGDIWEEDGIKWTIKNGLKQNITKLDKAKEILFPLFCKECDNIMNHKFDKEFYQTYQRCFNCQVKFETEIKQKGLWQEYEKAIVNPNIEYLINDISLWYDELINTNITTIYENGKIDQWYGSVREELLKDKEKTIQFLTKLKK